MTTTTTPLHTLTLRHPGGETPVLVGEEALASAAERLEEWVRGRTVFLVSTQRVMALHGERLAGVRGAAARSAAAVSLDPEPNRCVLRKPQRSLRAA